MKRPRLLSSAQSQSWTQTVQMGQELEQSHRLRFTCDGCGNVSRPRGLTDEQRVKVRAAFTEEQMRLTVDTGTGA